MSAATITDKTVEYQGVSIPNGVVLRWARRIKRSSRSTIPDPLLDQMEEILSIVIENSGIDREQILNGRGKQHVVCARFVCILLLREYTTGTHEQIADFVYSGSHDNAIRAMQRAIDRVGIYPEYRNLYTDCVEQMDMQRIRTECDQ